MLASPPARRDGQGCVTRISVQPHCKDWTDVLEMLTGWWILGVR